MDHRILKDRIGKIFLHCKGVDKIIIVNTELIDPNFFYATGFTSGVFEYSYLIIEKEKVSLYTTQLEYETARQQASEGMSIILVKDGNELNKFLSEALKGQRVGINGSFMPYRVYNSVKEHHKPKEIIDVSKQLLETRAIKDHSEIQSIRKAVSLTKWAMVLIQKEFKAGMTERELAAKFDNMCAHFGSQQPAFRTIACFGQNAAFPHHFPDDTKLKHGDFILIDAGSKIDNYSSDITRTWIFGEDKKAKDYEEKKRINEIVKEAQLKAIKKIKPGVKASSVHNEAEECINEAENGRYRGTFIHSLGHSLGIEVHDGPGFSPRNEQKLKPGMVITVEPGIYIPELGGVRIEDDILVTEKGAIVL